MLRLENIKKNYLAGGTSFPALKGISLAFRKNEFVSILGPSGCGKTTLLNIIGGLDHYSSGDLIIEGKSTKEYKSRDWDLYRNHRIGFIFQSYNLIPHQTICENVELALTISGYSKEEKRKKALKALKEVGLDKAYKKYPNQLSGGQCQRVAIARALVNEPDILLGDEPTGALDSKTSVQVMELIKKISKKKLVIMVTHNPPLAEKYSTRIISLLDGNVIKDTKPYSASEEAKEKRADVSTVKIGGATKVKPSKAKMSFWNAFKLSARNLVSKKKRTAMVIVASSIGIVGVSAVLAVNSGVRDYIGNMQNDMLSGNPVFVAETSLDLQTALNNLTNLIKAQSIGKSWKEGAIDVEYLTKILMDNAKSGSIINNDITDEYVEYIKEAPKSILTDTQLDYGLSFANNIYTTSEIDELETSSFKKNETAYSLSMLKNIYTAILGSLEDTTGGTSFIALSNIAANFPNIFYQGLDNNSYLKTQYDVLQGRLPNETDSGDGAYECVVVLNRRKKLADLIVTLGGLVSEKTFITAMYEFMSGNPNMDLIKDFSKISFEKIFKQDFYYVPNGNNTTERAYRKNPGEDAELRPYLYNPRLSVVKDSSGTVTQLKTDNDRTTIDVDGKKGNAQRIKVVGIIAPKEGKNYGSLSSGIYFRSPLTNRMLDEAEDKDHPGIFEYLKGSNYTNFSNYVFEPNNGEAENKINYGLTYNLDFNKWVKLPTGKYTLKEVNTFGTVGDSVLIRANSPHPTKQGVVGTAISSTFGVRALSGRKAVETAEGSGVYNYKKVPSRIYLYAEDFSKKDQVVNYLKNWNSENDITLQNDPKNPGHSRVLPGVGKDGGRVRITYNDNLTLVINMINDLITITTVSLTIFASLALVVSSVMIGIITYISVMERIKEIGVIRSLGGRKKDVSHLFNAETFIIGGISGVFGITITYLFELILDIIIYNKYKIPMIANLRWWTALIMILLSIVLTAISGLIPARSAAKKDPVTALRTE